MKQDLN